jgi:hypothetical protein
LPDAREPSSLFLRGIVGTSGAVVIYFFLQSGIISGQLFPKFDQIDVLEFQFTTGPDQARRLSLVFPNANLALLAVWSFLAGFSERLVPSILASTEAKLDQAGTKSS